MKMLSITLMILSVLPVSVLAREEVLTTTDNDDNNEIYQLIVDVNESTQALKKLYKDTYVNGLKIKRDILNEDDLKTKNGVILEKRDKHNVLNLKSDNFDHDLGGKITIDTLYNGITGERRSYELDLAKDKTGWKIFKGKKVVSKFHVKVNRVILAGTIGIKSVVME